VREREKEIKKERERERGIKEESFEIRFKYFNFKM